MTDWEPEVSEILTHAGWRPGREVDSTDWCAWLSESGFKVHASFRNFISEYGGLNIRHGGEGVARAREPIEFDPELARGEEDRFEEWGRVIGKTILPIGELDGGRFFLGLDEDGVLYLIVDYLARFGSGTEGLKNLLLGGPIEELFDRYPGSSGALPQHRRGFRDHTGSRFQVQA